MLFSKGTNFAFKMIFKVKVGTEALFYIASYLYIITKAKL